MVVMNDLEQLKLSHYVIYFEMFRNVMQQTEKEALICPLNTLFIYIRRLCGASVHVSYSITGYFSFC